MKNLEKFIKAQKDLTEIRTKGDLPVVIKGHRELSVLAAPYGGQYDGKDADGEYFSDNTDFMVEPGDKRPALYYHGKTPRGTNMIQPAPVGKGIVERRDKDGLWMDVSLKEGDPLADRVWEAAQNDGVRASSGSVNYLVRTKEDGEILSWPLAEISLIDVGQGRRPANELARVSLKSVYKDAGIDYPEAFVKSGELKTDAEKEKGVTTIKEIKMETEIKVPEIDVEAITAAASAKALEQFKAEKAAEEKAAQELKEAMDTVAKEAAEEARKDEQAKIKAWQDKRGLPAYNETVGKQDKHEFNDELVNWVKTGDHGNYKVFQKGESKKNEASIDIDLPDRLEVRQKALQVGSDTEGGYLVPDDARTQIVALREQFSWVRNAGTNIFPTNLTTVTIPTEATALAKLSVTAEEAAYTTNDPLFGEVSIPIYKFTKLTKVSEEMMDDNPGNFMVWYTRRLAEVMASTESYYVCIGTGSSQPQGVTVGGTSYTGDTTTIGVGDVTGVFGTLGSQYRKDAVWICNQDVESSLRALRDTSNWVFEYMKPGNLNINGDWKYFTFYGGLPIYNDGGMATEAASAKVLVLANMQYYALAERQSLNLARNPYLYQANGQIGLFANYRFGGAVTQAEAIQYVTLGT